jgi:hypothetical protein
MEKMEFPWLRDMKEPATTPEIHVSAKHRIWSKLRPHLPQVGVIALVGALALVGRCSSSEADETGQRRSPRPEILMMSLVAIPKGHVIPVGALTEVALKPGALSKTQRLRALLPDHIPKLHHEIVAKRDIAPQTPIFWTDLMLKPQPRSPATRTGVRIHFEREEEKP